jgi:hypothetical protein
MRPNRNDKITTGKPPRTDHCHQEVITNHDQRNTIKKDGIVTMRKSI